MRNLRVDDNPDRALRETSVSWRSGSGEQLSTAMPSYEPGGYASQPVAGAVEPVRAETEPVKPLRKAEKKSPRVEPVAKVAPAHNSTVATRSTRVYSPPLPETITQPSVPAVAPEVPKLPEVISRSEVSASHSPLVPVPQVATAPSALAASYTSPVAPGTVGLVDTATTVGDLVALPD